MDERLFFPATQRNKDCIGDLLSEVLPSSGSVLEIGSGSGEHGVIFQKRFPKIMWQTSDPELIHRKSIRAWIESQKLTEKMPQPIYLDVNKRPWSLPKLIRPTFKTVISINMIHISPWESAINLFEEASSILRKSNFLILYGPFKNNGKHISNSNSLFDKKLKGKNSKWGVRDMVEVIKLAEKNSFKLDNIIQMPANNHSIIFRIN